jgi:hypothetical protein
MEFKQYKSNGLTCSIPAKCRVRSQAPILTAWCKQPRIFYTVELGPHPSLISAHKEIILRNPVISDEHVKREIIRRGKGITKWPGIEMVVRLRWAHDLSEEYGWWHLFEVTGSQVAIHISAQGHFENDEADWLTAINSIVLEQA